MPNTEKLKEAGNYALAGRNAFERNEPRAYGCHYGTRSDRARSMEAFYTGYDEAAAEAVEARNAGWTHEPLKGLWYRAAGAMEPANETWAGCRFISVTSAGEALDWDRETPAVA